MLFFSGFSLYGAMLLLPLYYQDVRGTTALAAGVMLVPQGIGSVLSRTVAGSNIDRFGSRAIALAVIAAATVPFALTGPHTSAWLLTLCMVIRGFGLGAVTMPVMVAGYTGLDKEQIPHSSVLTRTAQQIGGSFGTVVLAVILEGAIAVHPKLIVWLDEPQRFLDGPYLTPAPISSVDAPTIPKVTATSGQCLVRRFEGHRGGPRPYHETTFRTAHPPALPRRGA